jgi:AcrR family transcriptional regulator
MSAIQAGKRSAGGLREHKKAKSRQTIQEQALRLFKEQGYEATTVDQIAEAAEVAQSTVFRYFHSKEDLVLQDGFGEAIVEAFQGQPVELSPIQALRGAFRGVALGLSHSDLARERERLALIVAVPELRAATLAEAVSTMQSVTKVMAERVGRSADDFKVRNFAGALIGTAMSALLTAVERSKDNYLELYVELLEEGLAHLEAGLPL